ncbi:MAG TPA: lysylphosphatidylglycerol synthase domain-containing protein [Polyangiaceae bacterium]|nr:lysylphosphatidylglycerol synthase domain-containing protein [Polyangiaceae bacterium]
MSERERRRRRQLVFVQNLIGAAIVAWFARYLWQRREHLLSILDVSVGHVAALSVVIVLTWMLTAAQSGVLYRASGIRIGFVENMLLTVGSAFGSYLPMLAGTVVRFHYMKSIHGLRYARSGSISWLRTILLCLSTALFGLFGTIGLLLAGSPVSPLLLAGFALLLSVPIVALVWPEPRAWLDRTPRARILRDFFDGLGALRRDRSSSLSVFVLIVLQQLCLAVRFAIAAQATGQSPSLLLLCILAPLAVFVSFVSVTPAALGLREAVMGYVTYATGTSFGNGLFVGTVDRAVLLAMVTLFGGSSLAYLWYKIRRADAARLDALGAPAADQS